MSATVSIEWKVAVSVPAEGPDYYTVPGQLFQKRTSNSFLKRIGGVAELECGPTILEPTNIFYDAMNRARIRAGLKREKLPFVFSVDGLTSPTTLNLSLRAYSKNLVLLSIIWKLPTYEIQKHSLAKHLELRNCGQAYEYVQSLVGLIRSGNPKSFAPENLPKSYPSVLVEANDPNQVLPSDSESVELLTRHPNPSLNIVQSVIRKNAKHQLTDLNSVLLDRQGIFSRSPFDSEIRKSILRKHASCTAMLELAIAVSHILQSNRNEDEVARVKKIVEQPSIVFLRSTTAQYSWELLSKEFTLQLLLQAVGLDQALPPDEKAEVKRATGKFGKLMELLGPVQPRNWVWNKILAPLVISATAFIVMSLIGIFEPSRAWLLSKIRSVVNSEVAGEPSSSNTGREDDRAKVDSD